MREDGFYWVKVTRPVCDGGGVVDELVGPPEIAYWGSLRWYLTGMEGPVCDQYDVETLSEQTVNFAGELPSSEPSHVEPLVSEMMPLRRRYLWELTEKELSLLRSLSSAGVSLVDKPVYWRGSVTDLVTDLEAVLTVEQLYELSGEVAVAWRRRRLLAEKS